MNTEESTQIRSVDEITRAHRVRYGPTAVDDYPDQLQAALNQAAAAHGDQLQALHREAGDHALTAAQQRRWDAHEREQEALQREAARLYHERREAQQTRTAERRARWGSFSMSGNTATSWDPGDNPRRAAVDMLTRAEHLDPAAVERLGALVSDERDTEAANAARILLARANPAYESAFRRLLTAPDPSRAFFSFTADEHNAFAAVENVRASLSSTTAGALLPLSYDPNLAALTSDGSANPIRALATVRAAATSPYRAVTSAGVTANWIAENTAISDGSPTFVGAEVPLYKLAAYVTASYELFADAGQELLTNLTQIFADARDTAENAVFISGSGSGAPTGIVTAISATSGVTVTATTRGTFGTGSAVDTFALINGLPPRARQSKSVAAFANNTTITTVRQQIIGTGGIPVVDVSGAVPSVAGVPWLEASTLPAATTSGNIMAVAGDFSRYLVVDHVAGPSLEYMPNVVDGSGVPTGGRGWIFWARVGADSLDDARFRILKA